MQKHLWCPCYLSPFIESDISETIEKVEVDLTPIGASYNKEFLLKTINVYDCLTGTIIYI